MTAAVASDRARGRRVDDGDLEHARPEVNLDLGAPLSVQRGVRERFLENPVGRLVGGRCERPARAVDANGHREPGAAVPLGERFERGKAGRRLDARPSLLG